MGGERRSRESGSRAGEEGMTDAANISAQGGTFTEHLSDGAEMTRVMAPESDPRMAPRGPEWWHRECSSAILLLKGC